mmetsp:Transcript_36809/g.106014  ORF Transcript_36809/g.106014 Transcript_36809/m.106014 type:complete len:231 (-) Transcript_36809:872-1564(-)
MSPGGDHRLRAAAAMARARIASAFAAPRLRTKRGPRLLEAQTTAIGSAAKACAGTRGGGGGGGGGGRSSAEEVANIVPVQLAGQPAGREDAAAHQPTGRALDKSKPLGRDRSAIAHKDRAAEIVEVHAQRLADRRAQPLALEHLRALRGMDEEHDVPRPVLGRHMRLRGLGGHHRGARHGRGAASVRRQRRPTVGRLAAADHCGRPRRPSRRSSPRGRSTRARQGCRARR